jgi:23S rRNA (guanine2445-N2)-methyltransferase / 23S rRNA (guanine2069-N7)-methyltransferase
LRALLAELAPGRRFLNLFAYTCTATVCAARGGASATVSVDLSATYLAWGRRNLELNGVAVQRHQLIRADCREWIEQEAARLKARRGREGGGYDLILLDPPTFSTSKAMVGTLDIQRDHVSLLRATSRLLSPRGVLLFSTNNQRFALDAAELPELQIEELRLLPLDFSRTPRIRRTYRVAWRE